MSIYRYLDKLCESYYNGNPEITDEEFDSLKDCFDYTDIGHKITNGVKHLHKMYSLEKFYEGEASSPLVDDLVESVKLDGAVIAAIYINTKLIAIHTRGNGKVGKDISHLIPDIDIPKKISISGMYQVNLEVVTDKIRDNARNYAAGALNLNSNEEFKSRELYFIAHEITPYVKTLYSADMAFLAEEGFNTVLTTDVSKFPNDGKVFRVNNNYTYQDILGFTSSHPKGAYALKKRSTGSITKLLDVVWTTSRLGIVAPVAILEPVLIGEAMVSRATLHNFAHIEALELEIGCNVEVVRSGEVIPKILRRV